MYGKVASRPYAYDGTVYGTARASPSTYFPHHLAAISSAIVTADALVILERAAYHMCHLARAAPAAPGRVLFDV